MMHRTFKLRIFIVKLRYHLAAYIIRHTLSTYGFCNIRTVAEVVSSVQISAINTNLKRDTVFSNGEAKE